MQNKNLITYFVLAYGISWLIWLPLYAPGLGLPVLPYHHALGGLGPMLAALILSKRNHEAAIFVARFVQWKPMVYSIVAFISPFVLVVLAAILHRFINGTFPHLNGLLKSKEFPEMNIIIFFLYNLFFFGFGEEAGWRGYALPRLQLRFNAFWSGTILTLFWALWHWPLFLYRPGYVQMDIGGIAGWLFSLLTGSILLSWLYHSSKGSILACAIFHATIDIAFTADVASPEIVNYTGMLITLWGIATVFVFGTKHLSRQ